MSICVEVRTRKRIQPKDIFNAFVDKGAKIVITSEEFPCLKFGEIQKAVRGIEINEEDYGYEVRICIGSNESDYNLFAQAIGLVSKLTGGEVYSEEDEKIDNASEYFDGAWIEKQMRSDCNLLYTMFRPSGEAIILYGLFAPICLGFQILSHEDNDMWNPDFEKYKSMLEYLAIIQDSVSDAKFAPHNLVIKNKDNDEDEKGLTAIHIANNEVTQFDFVPYNPLLAFIDEGNNRNIIIPFEKLRHISRNRGLHMFDDYQCGKCLAELMQENETLPIATYDVRDMMDDARRYKVDDIFYNPTYPGRGYDKQQRTYVLMWNPDSRFPDMDEDDFKTEIANLWPDRDDIVWDVSDCSNMRMGDRFFIVRNGQETNGIVMSGIFGSNAYLYTYSRKSFWAELVFNFAVDYSKHRIITIDRLKQAIPDFNWDRTFGCYKMKVAQAKAMESLFAPYFDKMKDMADGKAINATHYLH